MNLQVQKKDGRLQPFEKEKVAAGLIRSGASVEEAENVASQVEAWAQTSAVEGVVQSLDLRAKVLEILKTINENVATAYESYQKPQPQAEMPMESQPEEEKQEEPQV